MARRWTLHNRHRGKRGGVTVAVPGSQAGQPGVARVAVTLYGSEIIEGDHWSVYGGRSHHNLLREVHGHAQPIARDDEPAKDEPPMVQPVSAPVAPPVAEDVEPVVQDVLAPEPDDDAVGHADGPDPAPASDTKPAARRIRRRNPQASEE